MENNTKSILCEEGEYKLNLQFREVNFAGCGEES